MVHHDNKEQQQPQKKTTTSQTDAPKSSTTNGQPKTEAKQQISTPLIVQKVNKIPVVSFAVSMGFSQYDKLKSSSVTVGDVMTRAEGWALYIWEKVQPIVDKLQEPIGKADKLACNTFDFVEDKLSTIKIPQTVEGIVTKYKGVFTSSASNKISSGQEAKN